LNDYDALADHLTKRRGLIMQSWREVVRQDPTLISGSSMPREELNDHIPVMLSAFERQLRLQGDQAQDRGPEDVGTSEAPQGAAEHGLHRWQQGYDLREVAGELGRLNECMVVELDDYQKTVPGVGADVMAAARRLWAATCTEAISASVAQYYRLQQLEAAGQIVDLEKALAELRELEGRRAELWQQAAHDLRGNLGVVANATAGLASGGASALSMEVFLRLLQRNVASLNGLLDDVTSLARLQAGRETRRVASVDVAGVLAELAEGLKPLSQQKGIYLRHEGPSPMIVEADAVKVRRLAQNLLLNAIKFTHIGGVTLSWGNSEATDRDRWALTVKDTGPGFDTSPAATMAGALEAATNLSDAPDAGGDKAAPSPAVGAGPSKQAEAARQGPGEGIGLAIVKRLCDLLDATVECSSGEGGGTTFRILLPRRYP
jgi:signal transduction histidine kinase